MNAAHHFEYDGDLRVVFDHREIMYNAVAERVAGKLAQVENILYLDFFSVAALDAPAFFVSTSAAPPPTVPYPSIATYVTSFIFFSFGFLITYIIYW